MKSPLLSRCMFCNTSHLLQILHSVSTGDTGFLCRSQSKHFPGMDGANHNIFTEQPCLTTDSPSTGSSRVSIIVEEVDAARDPPPPPTLLTLSDSGDQCLLKEDTVYVHLTVAALCDGAGSVHHL